MQGICLHKERGTSFLFHPHFIGKCALHGKECITPVKFTLLVKRFILDNCGIQAQCFIDFELRITIASHPLFKYAYECQVSYWKSGLRLQSNPFQYFQIQPIPWPILGTCDFSFRIIYLTILKPIFVRILSATPTIQGEHVDNIGCTLITILYKFITDRKAIKKSSST